MKVTISSVRYGGTHHVIVLFVVALGGCVADLMCHSSDNCARMKPRDPNISLNDDPSLNVSCTLSKNCTQLCGLNSGDLYFKIWVKDGVGYRVVNQLDVWTVNKRTALLTSSDVTDNDTMISCWVRHNGEEVLLTAEHIYVGRPPYKPIITSVTIDNWNNMTISWDNEGVNKAYRTTYKAWWQQKGLSNWKECIRPTNEEAADSQYRGQCQVDKMDIFPRTPKTVLIKVNATNIVGTNTSDVIERETQQLVIPGKVKEVTVTNIGSRHAHIEWKSPRLGQSMKYNITFSCKWDNDCPRSIYVEDSIDIDMSYNVTDLHPYTLYNVTIQAMSSQGLLWSEPFLDGPWRTLEDRPSATPPVTKSSYWSDVINKTHRDVTIFWKAVPEYRANGVITKYAIREINSANKVLRVVDENVPGTVKSYTVKGLRVDIEYLFYMKASTDVGDCEDNTTAIEVPQSHKVPTLPYYLFEAQSESSVAVSWGDTVDMVSVTVYWCVEDMLHRFKCKGEVSWTKFDGSKRSAEITLTDGLGFKQHLFGIAVELNNTWSGIEWTECVYDETELAPARPKESGIESRSSDSVEFRLSAGCSDYPSRTVQYHVTYCLYDGSQQCDALNMHKCDEEKAITLDVNDYERYVIRGLQPDATYVISAMSLSSTQHESISTSFCAQTDQPGWLEWVMLKPVRMVLLILLCVFIVIMSATAIYGIRRYCCRDVQRWTKVPMVLPEHIPPTAEVSPVKREVQIDQSEMENKQNDLKKHYQIYSAISEESIQFLPLNSGNSEHSSGGNHVLVNHSVKQPSRASNSTSSDDSNKDSGVESIAYPETSCMVEFPDLNSKPFHDNSTSATTQDSLHFDRIPDSSGASHLDPNTGSTGVIDSYTIAALNSSIDSYPKVTMREETQGANDSPAGDITNQKAADERTNENADEATNQNVAGEPSGDGYAKTEERHVFNQKPEAIIGPYSNPAIDSGSSIDPYTKAAIDSGSSIDPYTTTAIDSGFSMEPYPKAAPDSGSSIEPYPKAAIDSGSSIEPYPKAAIDSGSSIEPYPKAAIDSGSSMEPYPKTAIDSGSSIEPYPTASIDSGSSIDPYPKAAIDSGSSIEPYPKAAIDSGSSIEPYPKAAIDSGYSIEPYPKAAIDSSANVDSAGYAATQVNTDFNQRPNHDDPDYPYLRTSVEKQDSSG